MDGGLTSINPSIIAGLLVPRAVTVLVIHLWQNPLIIQTFFVALVVYWPSLFFRPGFNPWAVVVLFYLLPLHIQLTHTNWQSTHQREPLPNNPASTLADATGGWNDLPWASDGIITSSPWPTLIGNLTWQALLSHILENHQQLHTEVN